MVSHGETLIGSAPVGNRAAGVPTALGQFESPATLVAMAAGISIPGLVLPLKELTVRDRTGGNADGARRRTASGHRTPAERSRRAMAVPAHITGDDSWIWPNSGAGLASLAQRVMGGQQL
jgi:hypothetical protein